MTQSANEIHQENPLNNDFIHNFNEVQQTNNFISDRRVNWFWYVQHYIMSTHKHTEAKFSRC